MLLLVIQCGVRAPYMQHLHLALIQYLYNIIYGAALQVTVVPAYGTSQKNVTISVCPVCTFNKLAILRL